MSGTSMDGIDLAYVKFTQSDPWQFEILITATIGYDEGWRMKLSNATKLPPTEINLLNSEYTDYLGGIIHHFIKKNKIKTLDFVASHGHTVFHQPEQGITLQIGNLSDLADHTAFPVVCDFRVQDLELGGQGAPLVPVGDAALFGQHDACLNLGGFSNLSLLEGETLIAYDICAVNTVLNNLSSREGLAYDAGGELAARGSLIPELFAQLEQLDFYSSPYPKSLGIEWVAEFVFKIIEGCSDASTADLLHTYTLHIAEQISRCLPHQGSVLVTGGGTHNTFLMSEIKKRSRCEIVIPTNDIIDFKEALIFAFLGLLRWQGEDNCLSSVTGATENHSSGKIFLPNSNIE
ncbi:MAG: anhydro-N-acetylmuramic acid kinase [Flavobacteriaceae bacterium]|nr:anhydro-N-acetylmuramic acid kinase [Flavobacteriaceae bacterium]